MAIVEASEVQNLLLKVINGESTVRRPVGSKSWQAIYAGTVTFDVDGWTLVVFNDCDSWDYVDHVVSPDGRRGTFDDWPDDARSFGLDSDQIDQIERVFTSPLLP